MLEIRPCCEHCGKDLPNTSTEAMICTFECTYREDCAIGLFEDVCPGCSGNFTKRPIRTKAMMEKYPSKGERIFNPKNLEEINKKVQKLKNIPPAQR